MGRLAPAPGRLPVLAGRQVAELSVRLDRCGRIERRLIDRALLRAEVCWDDDRAREAEAIGAGLAGRPAEVVNRLRGTVAGCDWLIRRWALLARAADVGGGWTAEQSRLAFDLLATPAEFRSGRPGEVVGPEGRLVNPADNPAAVARGQVAGLVERRARLVALEEVDRSMTIAGLADEPSPEIRRLRRHESSLHARIRWCLARLGRAPTGREPLTVNKPPRAPEAPAGPAKPAPARTPCPPPREHPDAAIEVDPIALRESRRELRELVAGLRLGEVRRPGRPDR